MKKKVFISFDYDHDYELKNTLIGQSKIADSPFSINDMSIKQAIDSKWKVYARQKIKACDVVIVICGRDTNTAVGVAAELTIAQEERKPYFLLRGRPEGAVYKPKNALSTDKIYYWTWDNLNALIDGKR